MAATAPDQRPALGGRLSDSAIGACAPGDNCRQPTVIITEPRTSRPGPNQRQHAGRKQRPEAHSLAPAQSPRPSFPNWSPSRHSPLVRPIATPPSGRNSKCRTAGDRESPPFAQLPTPLTALLHVVLKQTIDLPARPFAALEIHRAAKKTNAGPLAATPARRPTTPGPRRPVVTSPTAFPDRPAEGPRTSPAKKSPGRCGSGLRLADACPGWFPPGSAAPNGPRTPERPRHKRAKFPSSNPLALRQ